MPENQRNRAIATGEASRILKLYGLSSPTDLVLEDLALAMGVLVVEGPLDSADARLVRKGDRGIIRIKSDIPEVGRKRFAIAHELGHWILHRTLSQILACTSEDMLSAYKTSAPELEASYFASALIMPEEFFSKRIEGTTPTAELLGELAQEFRTSLTATALRYVDLRDDYCALVVSENGKVKWWRESRDFKGQFWIDPGTKLSSHTIAAGFFRGEPKPSGPEPVDLVAWLPDAAGIDSETIMEEAIPMPRYGQVLSMLWLP
ncbi:MAG: ImmA/IrrE family metallo-endopeptidase [Tepidisphaeraceae bacterium]|jgi:Zn-dependent peptidase ImmA (M78 family)